MTLNLAQSNVSLNDTQFTQLLSNLQANLLKGHGRNFAFHLFFSFDPSHASKTRTWIADFADTITTTKKQLEKTDAFKRTGEDGGTIFTLSLSAHGYRILGLESRMPKDSEAFKRGMRKDKDLLLDSPEKWTAGFNDVSRPIDMMILVANDNLQVAFQTSQSIINQVSSFASFLLSQPGKVLKKSDAIGNGIEHFGYADGISQPLYLANDIAKASSESWSDETNLDRLLVKDDIPDVDSFGSYLVFRKLEQNVKGFKDAEGDNEANDRVVTSVIDANGKPSFGLGGAMLVGRHEDGTPVEKSSAEGLKPVVSNDFDYSQDDISRCPFFAHTRIMNPRNGDSVAGDVRAQRITRRGIPFDDRGRFPQNVVDITDEMLKNQPVDGVGLLFMCYQSNIDTQFLILQQFWANEGKIKGHDIGTDDAIISQTTTRPEISLPLEWGKPGLNEKKFTFPSFVTNRGGEYLFTPSIAFLKSI